MECTRDYLKFYDDNLFEILGKEEKAQFGSAQGKELTEKNGNGGKMQALKSSSALCVNFFLYLQRNGKLLKVCNALGFDGRLMRSSFERPFETGTGKFKASVDYVIELDDLIIAFESKFTEHYIAHDSILKQSYLDRSADYKRVKDKIFSSVPEIRRWINEKWVSKTYDKNHKLYGLSCPYEYLDAAQLVKHILGLKNEHKDFVLVYVHYDYGNSEELGKHQAEVDNFRNVVERDNINFKSISYQCLFNLIREYLEDDIEYINYMKNRYLLTK